MRFAHGFVERGPLSARVVERAAVDYAIMPRFRAFPRCPHKRRSYRALTTIAVVSLEQHTACRKRPAPLSAVCRPPSAARLRLPHAVAGLASGAIGAETAVAARSAQSESPSRRHAMRHSYANTRQQLAIRAKKRTQRLSNSQCSDRMSVREKWKRASNRRRPLRSLRRWVSQMS